MRTVRCVAAASARALQRQARAALPAAAVTPGFAQTTQQFAYRAAVAAAIQPSRFTHSSAQCIAEEAATEPVDAPVAAAPSSVAAPLPSPSSASFGFDSVVDSENSFAAFLSAWSSPTHGPMHPSAVKQLPAGARRPVCVVAVSGGVDSAMTALLCQAAAEAGVYSEVHALHMRNWDEIEERGVCSGERDAKDARRLCAALGLPFTEVDFSREYYLDVFQPLLDEYARGNTPSPDVLCNRIIKFQLLLKHVQERFGPDAVLATGHYARIRHGSWGRPSVDAPTAAVSSLDPAPAVASAAASPSPQLFVAVDPRKDQSYFLSSVPASALRFCVFPLGHFHKTFLKGTLAQSEWVEARMKALRANKAAAAATVAPCPAENGLLHNTAESLDPVAELRLAVDPFSVTPSIATSSSSVAGGSSTPAQLPRPRLPPPASSAFASSPLRALSAKKESMGICFIGKRSMADFLADYLLLHRGHFVDVDTWAEIAPHDAWETLTIGQKANISGVAHKMYVCAKHTEQVQRQGEPPITVMPLPTPRVKEPASGVVRRDASGRRMRPLKPLPPTPRPPTSHTVFVCASKMHPALWCDELFMQEVQWIDETEPAELLSVDAAAAVDGTEKEEPRSMRVSVKIRSGHEQRTAMLVKLPRSNDASAAATAASPSSSWRVVFSSPQLAVAAGQSCVLYDVSGKRCLGQGRIERAGPSYFQQRKQLPVDALQQHSTDTTSTRN